MHWSFLKLSLRWNDVKLQSLAAISGFVNVIAKTLTISESHYINYQNVINGTETSDEIIMWESHSEIIKV